MARPVAHYFDNDSITTPDPSVISLDEQSAELLPRFVAAAHENVRLISSLSSFFTSFVSCHCTLLTGHNSVHMRLFQLAAGLGPFTFLLL